VVYNNGNVFMVGFLVWWKLSAGPVLAAVNLALYSATPSTEDSINPKTVITVIGRTTVQFQQSVPQTKRFGSTEDRV
jgi:hypothetical protein